MTETTLGLLLRGQIAIGSIIITDLTLIRVGIGCIRTGAEAITQAGMVGVVITTAGTEDGMIHIGVGVTTDITDIIIPVIGQGIIPAGTADIILLIMPTMKPTDYQQEHHLVMRHPALQETASVQVAE